MKKSTRFILQSLLLSIFSFVVLRVFSQEKTDQPTVSLGDQVTMKIGGFLRSDVFYDTHKNSEILDGLLDLFPLNKNPDSQGKDLNNIGLLRYAATASRLNMKFTGPDALNAKTSAFIEFDFTGYNGMGLRLRHAWLKLNWQNSELLFGRYWHPMFIVDAFPTVLALSTGAPFCIFNRAEQLRFTYSMGQLSLMTAAAGQLDYGFPVATQHNQVIPDLTANAQFKNDMIIFGVSGNYKVNQPKLSVTSASGVPYKTNEKIGSLSAEAYGQLNIGDLKVKGSVLYGQNMHELLMLSGYAIESLDTATGIEKYTPLNTMNYWANIVYGNKLQGILFIGYTKNLGSSSSTVRSLIPGSRGADIDQLIRVSPSISYKTGRLQFWLEIEHSIAAYGTNDLQDHAKVKNTKNVSNTRVQFASMFYF